jgi:glycosyltransferase involved in cell wall biosynthesis
MRQHRPDIVHTHTAKAGFVGRLAAWLASVPVRVHTFHGHTFHGYFSPAKTRLFIILERFCARLSTRVITISPKLRDDLIHTYRIAPPEKVVVVPLGLDLQPLAALHKDGANFRLQYGLPPDKKIVGIVGRLVPIKNHHLFLQVAERLVKQRHDVHFIIIGDGECRAELEQQVSESGINDHVSFLGWIEEVGMVLSGLDVLALTSNNEGTPVSIIEAMAAGVPVVATAVGGVADVLENGALGYITPPDDAELFAAALSQILDGDPPDTALAQKVALERYDISRLVHDLDMLYHDLLEAQ